MHISYALESPHLLVEWRLFDGDREEVFQKIQAEGVGMVVDIGADIESTKMAVELSEKYDFIYAAAGVHPSEIASLTEDPAI